VKRRRYASYSSWLITVLTLLQVTVLELSLVTTLSLRVGGNVLLCRRDVRVAEAF
jgi:hypothetical protein